MLSALVMSVLISTVGFILILLISFEIIIQIYPSKKVLPDGSVLRFEPLAQLFGSVIISSIISIAVFVFGYLKFSKTFEKYP